MHEADLTHKPTFTQTNICAAGDLASNPEGVPRSRPVLNNTNKPLTVALVNQKGGVGKTTLAYHLAAAAHLDRKRTLVLDLDSQGSALDWFAARTEKSPLYGMAVAKVDVPLTRAAFMQLTEGFDVVILDAPARLGNMTRAAAVAADVVVIPLQPSPLDLWACSDTIETLDSADEIREQLGDSPVRRLAVLNRAQANTKIARSACAAVDFAELLGVTVHQRVAFAVAATTGETVLTTDPRSAAAAEIWDLYGAILKALTTDTATDKEVLATC